MGQLRGSASLRRGSSLLRTGLFGALTFVFGYFILTLVQLQSINDRIVSWQRPLGVNPARLLSQEQILRDYIVHSSNALLARILSDQQEFLGDLASYREFPLTPAAEQLLVRLEHNYRDLTVKTRQFLREDNDLEKGRLLPQLLAQHSVALGELNQLARTWYQAELTRFRERTRAAQIATLGLLGTAAVLSLLAFRLQSSYYRVLLQNQETQLQLRAAEKEAYTDGMTGVNNYKYLQARFQHLAAIGTPFALLMIDIDNFKKINDAYGHLVGDEVLRHLTRTVAPLAAAPGFIARYGGEEFVIVAEGVESAETAIGLAQRVRAAVAETKVPVEGSDDLRFTISIGVSLYTPANLNDVFGEADAALYSSKRRGKNRVTLFGPPAQGASAVIHVM